MEYCLRSNCPRFPCGKLLLFDFEQFVTQLLPVVENTYSNPLFEQLDPGKHYRMLETRKGLFLSLLLFLSVYSFAAAQESRMKSGLFKKVFCDI